MNNAFKLINSTLGTLTDLAINVLVAGTIIGILYDDVFGVIAGIGSAVAAIGDGGVAGLVAVMVVAMWMKK
jgi:hypothetical protein|tara:strand:+ start:335 stop:547 length:213 start_codon:yes stop_codon:yes gene_type:complete